MIKKSEIEQTDFEALLDWLDTDRNRAGQKYEGIRERLIRIFCAKKCAEANELADETIDRVIRKVKQVSGSYQGDPALYFYAVSKNVFLEYTRRPKSEELPYNLTARNTQDDTAELYSECLEKCLAKLNAEQKQLVVAYYQNDKQEKIIARKELAKRFNLSNLNLRVRVLRIRSVLEKCVAICVEKNSVETFQPEMS